MIIGSMVIHGKIKNGEGVSLITLFQWGLSRYGNAGNGVRSSRVQFIIPVVSSVLCLIIKVFISYLINNCFVITISKKYVHS
ncbi:hypothetical protein Vsou_08700 [Vulcanisaeta souniana JCM 11219]|uniref:Uncharacterized protein n=1 Tax=Vulcanisaeta souniana JCM 11219 TaxID=1293586 RepID=A0ABN6SRZ3_9CREN|nr:hypothetical protein Vsou_08700 [Vulcanisaeta souniana JCM 11219]